jgi:hypothetical protein
MRFAYSAIFLICIAVFATANFSTTTQAMGGGGLGLTFGNNPYTGPYYSYNPPPNSHACMWKRRSVVDHRGRRIFKRTRVC